MKVSIMQPYFFPYIGYFSLIYNSDKFIFFDTPQYIKHGWVNRNRILKNDGTSTYIIVPIKKAHQSTPINEIMVNNDLSWKNTIYGQLSVYKKRAPYYNFVNDILHDIIDKEWNLLSDLNIYSTEYILKILGIKTEIDVFSKMNLDIDPVNAPDEWALNITKVIGYDTYINPPGGIDFFSKSKYEKNNIELKFLKAELLPYIQRTGRFESGLSIVDVMMFCSLEEINSMLKNITYL